MDFFRGLPVTVDMEKDLSLKQQRLDVVLIRKEAASLPCRLPDGFEDLRAYNLLTFKSHKEKLSVWSLQELVGHYVNLRKQESPSMDEAELLAEDQFRLFAVTARYPQQLGGQARVPLREVQQGVYDIEGLALTIRVVVANQLPLQEHNAMLHLFGAKDELLRYGKEHYHIRSAETSSLLQQLFQRYQEEIPTMPDLLEELTRQTIEQLLKELPVEKRLEGLSPEERVKGLSPATLRELADKLEGNGGPAKPE
jgi:hypothetical protein